MIRLDWEEVRYLIDTKKFFVLHAPRQTGKTTTLLAIMDVLNQSDAYTTLYINVESAQAARGDVALGMRAIIESLVEGAAIRLKDNRLRDWRDSIWQGTQNTLQITRSHPDRRAGTNCRLCRSMQCR